MANNTSGALINRKRENEKSIKLFHFFSHFCTDVSNNILRKRFEKFILQISRNLLIFINIKLNTIHEILFSSL